MFNLQHWKQKRNSTESLQKPSSKESAELLFDNILRIFDVLKIFDVLPNFLSAQVKRSLIVRDKHGILYELPNDVEWDPGKSGSIRKISKLHWIVVQCLVLLPKWFFFSVPARNRKLKNRNWTFPELPYFTWKIDFVSNILSMIIAAWNLHLQTQKGTIRNP